MAEVVEVVEKTAVELEADARAAAMDVDDLAARIESVVSEREPATEELKQWDIDADLTEAGVDEVSSNFSSVRGEIRVDDLDEGLFQVEEARRKLSAVRERLLEVSRPDLSLLGQASEPAVSTDQPAQLEH